MTDDELGPGPHQKPRQRGLDQQAAGEARDTLPSGEPGPTAETARSEQAEERWNELMEEVVAPANIAEPMKRVRSNRGSRVSTE